MYTIYSVLLWCAIPLYSMFNESNSTILSQATECIEEYSSQIPNFSPQTVANDHIIAILGLATVNIQNENNNKTYCPQLHLIQRTRKDTYSTTHINDIQFGRRGIALDNRNVYVSTANNHMAILDIHSYRQKGYIPISHGQSNISGLAKNQFTDGKIAASISAWNSRIFHECSYIMYIDLVTSTTTKFYSPYCIAYITYDPTENCIATQSWKNICTIADTRTGNIEIAWHDARAELTLFPDSIAYDPSGKTILSSRHTKNNDVGFFSIFDIRNRHTHTHCQESIISPFFIDHKHISIPNIQDNNFNVVENNKDTLSGIGTIKPSTAIHWSHTVLHANKTELIGKIKNNPYALITCTF